MITATTFAIFALLITLATVIGLDELDQYEDYWVDYSDIESDDPGQAPSYLDLIEEIRPMTRRSAELPLDVVDTSWLVFVGAAI